MRWRFSWEAFTVSLWILDWCHLGPSWLCGSRLHDLISFLLAHDLSQGLVSLTCAQSITFSLIILYSFSFPYLLVMMFWHHLLLYNWNCTERGALWTTMKIHKIHPKILFKHKKTQFRLNEIWHWTSVIAFGAPISVLDFLFLFLNFYCPLSIPQVYFVFDDFLVYFWSFLFHV